MLIDQAKIDAPKFPRSQEWWDRFTGVGTTATVHDDETVTLEANGEHYDYATWMADPGHHDKPCPVAGPSRWTVRDRRRAGARLEKWVRECASGRLAAGIVEEAGADA